MISLLLIISSLLLWNSLFTGRIKVCLLSFSHAVLLLCLVYERLCSRCWKLRFIVCCLKKYCLACQVMWTSILKRNLIACFWTITFGKSQGKWKLSLLALFLIMKIAHFLVVLLFLLSQLRYFFLITHNLLKECRLFQFARPFWTEKHFQFLISR